MPPTPAPPGHTLATPPLCTSRPPAPPEHTQGTPYCWREGRAGILQGQGGQWGVVSLSLARDVALVGGPAAAAPDVAASLQVPLKGRQRGAGYPKEHRRHWWVVSLLIMLVLGLFWSPAVAAAAAEGRGAGSDPKLIGSVAKLESELGQALNALQQPATQQPETQPLATQQLTLQHAPSGMTQRSQTGREPADTETAQAGTVPADTEREQGASAETGLAGTPPGEVVSLGSETQGGRAGDVTREGVTKGAAGEKGDVAQQTEHSRAPASNDASSPAQSGQARLVCPDKPSVLYSAAKVRAAHDIGTGKQSGLLAWDPPQESPRYLVMFCQSGQISNRVVCIRNSIILAGLLNRTLVVDTLQPEYSNRHYSWATLLDTSHLRSCFGPKAVTTTKEYWKGQGPGQSEGGSEGGRKLRIDRLLCWAVRPQWAPREEATVTGTVCASAEHACEEVSQHWAHLMGSFDVGGEFKEGFQQNLCARSLGEVLEMYRKWEGERVILAGELTLFGLILPENFTASAADVPFQRVPGCPSPLAILPHPEIVLYAQQQAQSLFSRQPFLALHLRRKDFLSDRCKRRHWLSVCVRTEKVAQCLAAEINATGIPNMVLCSDTRSRELDILNTLVSQAVGRPVSSVHNPLLPPELRPLIGRSKEGHATFQKLLMAQAAVFLGTDHSSFTGDVQRLRHGMGSASCRDRFICEGTEYEVSALDPFLSMLL